MVANLSTITSFDGVGDSGLPKASRPDRPGSWPDLSGRTPGLSGQTSMYHYMCIHVYANQLNSLLVQYSIIKVMAILK